MAENSNEKPTEKVVIDPKNMHRAKAQRLGIELTVQQDLSRIKFHRMGRSVQWRPNRMWTVWSYRRIGTGTKDGQKVIVIDKTNGFRVDVYRYISEDVSTAAPDIKEHYGYFTDIADRPVRMYLHEKRGMPVYKNYARKEIEMEERGEIPVIDNEDPNQLKLFEDEKTSNIQNNPS